MSTFCGKRLKLDVRGASHSRVIGFSLEGFPVGLSINREALSAFMKRRAPGNDPFSTSRREADEVEFFSGVEPS
jgi:chorismate synthase